ncbi:MAG: succinylglutamate desuccinylase/aspartoacylase family protein [Armatimonadetes bacterium]|nr:succinylglutamate desuccinylase/aspartoacylase family protein [Armatimonadota bacterium]MDE2206799.1 succinylglutamate desuccinylase/aspartoacylase family protein [Armatimonadota bacterium]
MRAANHGPMFRTPYLLFCLVLACASPALAQTSPLTRAESSGYTRTSSWADVNAFLKALQLQHAPITVQTIGKSAKGKAIPLVVVSQPPVRNVEQARASGRLVVYIEANIHAGEVEGKEAVQILMRQLAHGKHPNLLRKLVLVITPIYNIDGNDAFGPESVNRSEQDGPEIVGQRANGQGLDLNRDCIKAESPEMRAALKYIYTRWNPDAVLDLHTTDGTRHGFTLTYAPAVDPNTDPRVMHYMRGILLPEVRRELARRKMLLFDYGDAVNRNGTLRWETFEPGPRYVTNYAGAIDRISVLSEAVCFLPFKERVRTTLVFITQVLDHLAADATHIRTMLDAADARARRLGQTGTNQLGVRFAMASRGIEPVPLEALPPGVAPIRNRPVTRVRQVAMPIYDRFRVTQSETVPEFYVLPRAESAVAQLLRLHGVRVVRLKSAWTGTIQQFWPTAVTEADRPYQGHRMLQVDGGWRSAEKQVDAGSWLIPMNQRLARLIFEMLEPENADSVVGWNLLHSAPEVGAPCSIERIMAGSGVLPPISD